MRILRYTVRFLLLFAILVILVVVGGLFYIQSNMGLDWITRTVNTHASSEDLHIKLSGLRGKLFSNITLAELKIADREGVWLEIQDVHLVWNPRALMNKQAPFTTLEAERIKLLRLPEATEEETPPSSDASTMPDIREYAIYLPRNLHVAEFVAAKSFTGKEQRISIQGSGDAAKYTLMLNTLAGVPLSLDAMVQPQQEDFAIKLAFHEAEGGVVAALLGLPHSTALALDADITTDEKGDIDIHTATLRAGSLKANIHGSYAIPQNMADITLSATAQDMEVIQALSNIPLSGSIKLDLTAKGTPDEFTATLNVTTPHLMIEQHRLEAFALSAKAEGGIKQGITLVTKSNGLLERKSWQLAFEGKAQEHAPQQYQVDVTTLTGSYDNAPIRMASPATFIYEPEQISLSPFILQLAGGSIRAEGKQADDTITGKITISTLALDKLPGLKLPEAVLDVSLDVSGATNAPVLVWSAKTDATLQNIKLAANAKGSWKNGTVQSELNVQSEEATAQLQASLPASLSLQPFATDIGVETALKGSIKTSLPLTMFNALLYPDGHRVNGIIAGNATLGGNIGNPRFNGTFTLNDGRYDHAMTGICLRDMHARISGNKQAIRLEEFSATDNKKHHFTATGDFVLGNIPTITGEARFDQFRLFCGGMMEGQIDGVVSAKGTTNAMKVAGRLELGPLNIQIPGAHANSNIPQVEAEWVRPSDKQHDESTPSVIDLDIVISAPQKLFIRGRGLDAEFGGELAITGTATTPEISGQFSKKRGTFILLDRVLALDTATVKFEGPVPPSPFLNIISSTKVNANTINVLLAGSAIKPKLTLSSTPPLPQDELLALLLFGRQLDRISPFEAVQLAQATRTLAGLSGDGPGLVGSIRNMLGLDRLEVGADANSNINVSTGKYISDDVYVGVVQGTKPEDRKVVTEITLTPSVSGKTAVDSVGNQSVGMEWKHDY